MACERFVYTENLAPKNGQTFDGKGASPWELRPCGEIAPLVEIAPPSAREEISRDGLALLTRAVQQTAEKSVEEGGWVNLGHVTLLLNNLQVLPSKPLGFQVRYDSHTRIKISLPYTYMQCYGWSSPSSALTPTNPPPLRNP